MLTEEQQAAQNKEAQAFRYHQKVGAVVRALKAEMAHNVGAKGEQEWIDAVDLVDCLEEGWETKGDRLLTLFGSFRGLYISLCKLLEQVKEIGVEGKTTVGFRQVVTKDLKAQIAVSALLMP